MKYVMPSEKFGKYNFNKLVLKFFQSSFYFLYFVHFYISYTFIQRKKKLTEVNFFFVFYSSAFLAAFFACVFFTFSFFCGLPFSGYITLSTNP